MENYREVTYSLVQMEGKMAEEAKRIQKTYDDARSECCNRFGDGIMAIVKQWSKDDFNQWCKTAQEDDAVSSALYHAIINAWVVEHINEVIEDMDGIAIVEVTKHGKRNGASALDEVLSILASVYEDLHG